MSDPNGPAIILVSQDRAEFLLDEFGRYARDYELRTATSAEAAETEAHHLGGLCKALAMARSMPTSDAVHDYLGNTEG